MSNSLTYKPVPIIAPALSAMLVLSILFWFGLGEQQSLVDSSVEEVVSRHEKLAYIVAINMETELQRAQASIDRYSQKLSQGLEVDYPKYQQQFNRLFRSYDDGTVRSRKFLFDGNSESGVWIPTFHTPTNKTKKMFVNAKVVTDHFGSGAHGQAFVDTWFLPKVGGIVIFWPEVADYVFQAEASFDYSETEWVVPTQPKLNPQRKSYWTRLSFDPTPKIWMLSVVAPLYWADEWFGSVGHDVPLANVIASTDLIRQQEGGRFILLTDELRVAASDVYEENIKRENGELLVSELKDKTWARVAEHARKDAVAEKHQLRYSFGNHVFFVSHIKGQNWLLINSIPLEPIHQRIGSSFNNLRNIAIGSLFLELLIATSILAWSHRRYTRYLISYQEVQQQLERREKRYRTLVANVPGIVYRCKNDVDWTMDFMSNTTKDITGYEVQELLNNKVRSFASIIHPDDLTKVDENVQKSIAKKQEYALEFRIIRKDKEVRWMLEQGLGIFEGEKLLCLEGVILDITERHQIQTELEIRVADRTRELSAAYHELEKAMDQLVQAEKLASLGSLVAGVAHELNTPLGNLMTVATHWQGELNILHNKMITKSPLDTRFVQHVEESLDMVVFIENNCKIAVDLVEKFKELSVDQNSMRRRKFQLSEMVDMLLGMKSNLIQSEYSVHNHIPKGIVMDSYPGPLEQVLTNLINNSILHGFEGKQDGNIFIDARQENNNLTITYKDDGVGIPEKLRKHIYDPFSTTKMAQGGGGLGMYLVYNLVCGVLKGSINLVNSDSPGVKFIICLPASPNDEPVVKNIKPL